VPDKEEVLLVDGLEFFGVRELLDTSFGEEVQKPVIIRFRRSLQAARSDGGGTGSGGGGEAEMGVETGLDGDHDC
jgi:hypothetical protein